VAQQQLLLPEQHLQVPQNICSALREELLVVLPEELGELDRAVAVQSTHLGGKELSEFLLQTQDVRVALVYDPAVPLVPDVEQEDVIFGAEPFSWPRPITLMMTMIMMMSIHITIIIITIITII
jgi:hypothetical protein